MKKIVVFKNEKLDIVAINQGQRRICEISLSDLRDFINEENENIKKFENEM